MLPSDDSDHPSSSDTDSGVFSASDNANDSSDDAEEDITQGWLNIHTAIKTTISDLGGKVIPKLNWSAPKDATWMNANTMECRTPSDVYLLLKSSDFITHDLEHAFDDTVHTPDSTLTADSIPYYLVLRKAVSQWNPSVEFRCFVRHRRLLCLCQRDLNHFEFLEKMSAKLRSLIQQFFDVRLRDSFEDENFVFDVYVPPPYERVWLVDINPWAPRTDPLLFSWGEILSMPEPPDLEAEDEGPGIVRLSLNTGTNELRNGNDNNLDALSDDEEDEQQVEVSDSDSEADESIWLPELRLVRRTDAEAFGFNAPQYSAHKLPKDVVEAAQSGEGLMEFARDWREILARRQDEEKNARDGDTE